MKIGKTILIKPAFIKRKGQSMYVRKPLDNYLCQKFMFHYLTLLQHSKDVCIIYNMQFVYYCNFHFRNRNTRSVDI